MTTAQLVTLTDENFEQEIESSEGLAIVDFWAEWCGPCLRLAPAVEAIAGEFDGRLIVGKLNVDENPAVAMRFGIRGIPTLLLFKDGQVVDTSVGLVGKDDLRRMVEKHV